jgi:HPt (histidine-containing phosphotransfer) domain-containing protein
MANEKGLDALKKAMPCLELEKGLEYSAGSKELYIELLEEFIEIEAIKELEEKYEKEDKQYYVTEVHAKKGLARTLGFDEFGDLAEKVQYAGQDGTLTDEMHRELIERYDEIITISRECVF